MLKLHLHRLLVSSWLSVPGGEELVAAVDPRRRGVVITHLVWKWFLGKNLLWIFLSFCIQISAGVLLSDGLAEKNSLWWRHGWCPWSATTLWARAWSCSNCVAVSILISVPGLPHNKIDSHCQHHSLHSLIRDWLSAQSHVTTFATSASVISR